MTNEQMTNVQMQPVVLSYIQAERMLRACEAGRDLVVVSLDLGLTTTDLWIV